MAYLQHRSTLPTSPLSLKLQVLLGPEEHVDPPNTPTPIPMAAPVACREGVGEIPSDAWYTDAWKKKEPPQPMG